MNSPTAPHRPRARRITAVLVATGALVMAGCGGDDDADATPREQLVADLADSLDAIEGLEVDEACLTDKVAELTDAQVTAMSDVLDSGGEAPADLADWNASISDCLGTG